MVTAKKQLAVGQDVAGYVDGVIRRA